ncbi:MAG: type VI secretion system baseplate subunit TssG [Calditrichaeota bacterium]|nr:MAG: type VI secretion system baseplate subunit TssG [Calditrichota bacterium]
MAADPGKYFARLREDFHRNACRYSFFYTVYRCERLTEKLHPQRRQEMLDQAGLRFRPYEHYVYPPSNIRSLDFDGEEVHMVVNFLGLYGINAPLPRCYHEQVAFQQAVHGPGNVPLQNFLDIFNNRFYWLYYQAWKKYRTYLDFGDDPHSKTMQRLFAFVGLGPRLKEGELAGHRFRLLRLSGLLSMKVRNKVGLLTLLKEFFPRLRFQVEENIPTMVPLAERPLLGRRHGDRAFRLGSFSVIGRSVMDCMSRIRLKVGPLHLKEYLEFLPGGPQLALLTRLLSLYVNDGLEYDLRFIIRSESIGEIPWRDPRLRLGQSLWLGRPQTPYVTVDMPYEKLAEKNVSA